jgi:hypothetical protein
MLRQTNARSVGSALPVRALADRASYGREGHRNHLQVVRLVATVGKTSRHNEEK